MTAAELRDALASFPADAPVYLAAFDGPDLLLAYLPLSHITQNGQTVQLNATQDNLASPLAAAQQREYDAYLAWQHAAQNRIHAARDSALRFLARP